MQKKPSKLVRFGVSMDESLVRDFDRLLAKKSYPNRSEALRDYVRQDLNQEGWKGAEVVTGVLSLIYDHHQPNLLTRISHMEHENSELILSNQHVHLDHFNCLEVLTLRGKPEPVQALADKLRALKGVTQGSFSIVKSR